MNLLVVGSTAFDSIETPTDTVEDCLGGSAVHFSLAAALFGPQSGNPAGGRTVRLVSVVGEDFPKAHVELLQGRGIDTAGIEIAKGKTFRWRGRYAADMNSRQTLDVQLNTFGEFKPRLPKAWHDTGFVFLANGSPTTQMSVLDQMTAPRFVIADTMNLWIETMRPELDALLRRVDGLILNDEEARMLSGHLNLIKAGRSVLRMGPKIVIVKKGEHGSFLFSELFQFALPAYPVETVVDPTGAGDAFAGGFMGHLSSCDSPTLWNIKRAMAYGTVAASINVEGYGVDALVKATRDRLDRRYADFVEFIAL